ncbi:MAG TPA: GNAT family N-acetyltransferase [Porticoccaceae bacterium]|nr:GNAT family N-acetyltransferase [Gammaproteobacteria bacterium]HIL61599.1 GNAT family N-acetyltransferase [Porticoccaceae bacterium]
MDDCRKTPIHALIAGIALPNEASIVLHEKQGFVYIGQFDEVGQNFGKFINVGY